MKRFCDLKVGDLLSIYALGYSKEKITGIKIKKNYMIIDIDYASFIINEVEKDFMVHSVYSSGDIDFAISTSMDRLLLELEEC